MTHYEIVMLVHSDRTARADGICDRISELVSEGRGKVHRREDIGRRSLAYAIAGLQKAHYSLMNVECGLDTYGKVEEYLRFNDDVLRRLTVRCKKAETALSELLKQTQKMRAQLSRGVESESPSGEGEGDAREDAQGGADRRESKGDEDRAGDNWTVRRGNLSREQADAVDYKNVQMLKSMLTITGKIIPCRNTGVTPYLQRRLTAAIKRARYLALLPYCDRHS